MVNVALGFAASQVPTDRFGASAAQVVAPAAATAITAYGLTLVGAPGSIVAGMVLFHASGYWAVVKVTPTTTAVEVHRWFRAGAPGANASESIPPNGNVSVWPAQLFVGAQGGVKLKKANFVGVGASTLTVRSIAQHMAAAGGANIPSLNTVPVAFDYGDGIYFDGPVVIACSSATIIGHLELVPA